MTAFNVVRTEKPEHEKEFVEHERSAGGRPGCAGPRSSKRRAQLLFIGEWENRDALIARAANDDGPAELCCVICLKTWVAASV